MKNRSRNLDRSLTVLSHPLTVLAFTLYLINTFWLQRIAPSWWTGKLGDFAWLFFFPFVLCVPLSLLIPRRFPDQQIKIIYIAVAWCGVPFALLKSSPPLLDIASETFKGWFGVNFDLVSDPSDLIALASLVGAVLFWNHHRPTQAIPRKFAYTLAVFSVIFTLADSAAPDRGVYYVGLANDHLFACASYGSIYQSGDGGMSWSESRNLSESVCGNENDPRLLIDPSNKRIQYKYGNEKPGEIYRSEDAGVTWVLDYNWTPKDRHYTGNDYMKDKPKLSEYYPYPLRAIYEPESGNVIFAMAGQGVLVRQPSGEYFWVQVGPYKNEE